MWLYAFIWIFYIYCASSIIAFLQSWKLPRAQTPVFCSFFPPLLMVSYRYVVLNTINMPMTHIYISIPVSPLPWTPDSYVQLSVPYLQAQDVQTKLLMCSPKLDVHATFLTTIDDNSILSVAQPKNWFILDPVFLSHTHHIW